MHRVARPGIGPRRPIAGDEDESAAEAVRRPMERPALRARRLTKPTNAFSKSLESQKHAMALQFLSYNPTRRHATVKTTPAVAAGIAERPVSMLHFAAMLEKEERVRGIRLTSCFSAVVSK